MAADLRTRLRDNDVLTKQEFIDRTIRYWTIQTGMGMAFFLTALLAVLIGGAVVGQAIFANTMEHLREYGTLKAMGARNRDIMMIFLLNSALVGLTGGLIGISLGAAISGALPNLLGRLPGLGGHARPASQDQGTDLRPRGHVGGAVGPARV